MKVTVFNGSPRGRDSNTHRIVEPLLEGAREAGAEAEEVFLVERDIKHCRGC
jgi:multimeric flavodoxin WrbA